METTYKPKLFSFWRRTTATTIGGRAVQWWFRIHHLQIAVGWVTRYVGVPKFFFFKRRVEGNSMAHVAWITQSVELHVWRLRFGFKYWR